MGKELKEIVKKVGKIARLSLSEEEIEKYSKQLEDVLKAFEIIKSVDTSGLEPSFHVKEIKNVWREDKVKKIDWNPLDNAKHKERGYFKGPKILD